MKRHYVIFYLGWSTIALGAGLNVFTAGNPISASQMNANFSYVVNQGVPTLLYAIWSYSVAVSNATVVFTGAAGSSPSWSGSTLTLPSNSIAMSVEIWGAGGGGAGGCNGSAGSAGGSSSFSGTSVSLSAGGGGGGGSNSSICQEWCRLLTT